MQSPSFFRTRAVAAWAVSVLGLACGGDDIIAPDTGGITVTTATTGPPSSTAGYTIRLDEGAPRPIDVNASLTLSPITPGEHSVRLEGLSGACTVAGANPRRVDVPAGDPVELRFEITCAPLPSGVTIVTTTTGLFPDPDGYTVQVDREPGLPIAPNASLSVGDLSAGMHRVELDGVASNCTVEGDNPRTIEVVAGAVLAVEFAITCSGVVQRWTRLDGGTRADLPDVWGSSGTDVFVVGEVEADDGVASLILRYDGTRWDRQLRQTDLRLRGVWGTSATNAFAVGFRFFSPDAAVFRYDGTQWSEVPGFASDGSEALALNAVWGSSATDVFAVGEAFDGQFSRSLIFQYDGTGWRRLPEPEPLAPTLLDVWGSASDDVYVVGRDDIGEPASGVILRYDGAAWTPVVQEEGLLLNGIWGSSASDVFAVGFEFTESDGNVELAGTVRHFDGTAWSRMTVPAVGVLHEVWGSSSSDVFAVGEDGVVLHYDGATWTESRPGDQTLLGVWGASPFEVFAVGNRGLILRGTP